MNTEESAPTPALVLPPRPSADEAPPSESTTPAGGLPIWIYGYALLLPLQIPLPFGLVPSDLFGFLGIAHLGLQIALRWRVPLVPGIGWFAAFLAISLLGRDILIFPRLYLYDVGAMGFLSAIALALGTFLRSEHHRRVVTEAFSLTFFPLLLVLFVATFFKASRYTECLHDPGTWRLAGPFQFANQLALYLMAIIPFIIFQLRTVSKLIRIPFYVVLFVVLSNIASRSSMFIGFWQVFLAERYLVRDSWNKKQFLAALAPILAIGLYLFFKNDFLFIRTIGFNLDSPSLVVDDTRAMLLQTTASLFPEWWLTGLGLGCFKARQIYEVHHFLVSAFAETGLFGGGVFLLFLTAQIKTLHRALTRAPASEAGFIKALVIAFSGLCLMGMLHNILRNRIFWFLLGLIFSLSAALRQRGEKSLFQQAPDR